MILGVVEMETSTIVRQGVGLLPVVGLGNDPMAALLLDTHIFD